MHESRISVIIPALNEEKRIGFLVRYLHENQAGYVDEIIVADGGSSDKTREIAEKQGAKVIRSKKKGRGVQMNDGAAAAKNPVLFFLHADTTPPKKYDLIIIKALTSEAAAGCFQLRFDDPHPLLKLYATFTALKTTLVRFGDQGLFVRRSFFLKSGGFDESLFVMEDQKMVRELKKLAPFVLLDKTVITSARKYRTHGVVCLQVIFILIWAGYYLGVPQDILMHFYSSVTD